MKQKLIFVTEALWIGGIETALVNLLNRLDGEKFDITCLILRDARDLAPRLPANCRLIVADREHPVTFANPYRFKWLAHLTEEPTAPSVRHRRMMWAIPLLQRLENRLYIRYLQRNLAHETFDTCVIYSDRTAEAAVRGIRAGKYLMFYHNALPERAPHDEIGYRKSRRIFVVSRHMEQALRELRPRYRDKYEVLPNLTDDARVREMALETPLHPFPEQGFCIVTCGRLVPQKGLDLAVEACKFLRDRGCGDIHWWILGSGREEAALRQQIREAGLEDTFRLPGAVANPYPYMARCDVYVQPSRQENDSLAVLEAMALCKPIVATFSAAGERIESGVNGLLCMEDAQSIACAIEHLYRHPQERERYARALRENGPEGRNAEILARLCRALEAP